MERTVETLRLRMRDRAVDLDENEVFELLSVACFLCCRDGDRGGNKDCAPKTELVEVG